MEVQNGEKKCELKLAQGIKSNPKFFFSYVRLKSRTKYKVGPLKDNSDNMVSDETEICGVKYIFSSVFTNESNSMNMPEVIRILQVGSDEMLSHIMVLKILLQRKY